MNHVIFTSHTRYDVTTLDTGAHTSAHYTSVGHVSPWELHQRSSALQTIARPPASIRQNLQSSASICTRGGPPATAASGGPSRHTLNHLRVLQLICNISGNILQYLAPQAAR